MAQLTKEYLDEKLGQIDKKLGDLVTKDYLEEQFEKQAQLINRAFQEQKDYFDKQIQTLETRMIALEQTMIALSNKVTHYLELSEKRYLELKRRDLVIAKWLKQVADKTGVEIDFTELERF